MGSGHMEPPHGTDRHNCKHYLPATSLTGGNNSSSPISILYEIRSFAGEVTETTTFSFDVMTFISHLTIGCNRFA